MTSLLRALDERSRYEAAAWGLFVWTIGFFLLAMLQTFLPEPIDVGGAIAIIAVTMIAGAFFSFIVRERSRPVV